MNGLSLIALILIKLSLKDTRKRKFGTQLRLLKSDSFVSKTEILVLSSSPKKVFKYQKFVDPDKITGYLTSRLEYLNFETYTKQKSNVYTNADNALIATT